MQDITIRQMDFGFPEKLDPIVFAGRPEESYPLIGLSLLLPYLEPYLIRTMREARRHVQDPDLAGELAKFSGQEGQHYKQHILFNDAVKAFGIPFPGLAALEEALAADYARFSEQRPLRWNLAYAEGFEALTTASAHAMFVRGADPDLHPAASDLFSWHMIEELEHRTVAFDVYHHVCGSYAHRLAVGTWAQWHMARWITRAARLMLDADPRVPAAFGDAAARRRRRLRATREGVRDLLPRVLRTYLPRYTPHHIDLTPEMRAMAAECTAAAVRTQ